MTKNKGYALVSRARYNNGTKEVFEEGTTEEQLSVPNFDNLPTARVTVSGGLTKNLGNFESARIDVEVSLPCYPVEEEIVRVYGIVQELVTEMLEEQNSAFDPVQVVR